MKTRREILAASGGALVLVGCKRAAEPEESTVAPAEDLMREHGVLARLLLVFETCAERLDDARPPHVELAGAADLVRRFVEDYHEALEEQHLFPRFQRATLHDELVDTLVVQHRAGRAQTDVIIEAAGTKLSDAAARERARKAIAAFARMYRSHASREDTVLFPDLHKVASGGELAALGETFEREERTRFGVHGFETVVEQVAQLERALGIYELARVTPTQS